MKKNLIIQKIIQLQDVNGCWNVDHSNSGYSDELTYYVPNYKSTLWTLILLADIEANREEDKFKVPLGIIAEHFWNEKYGIFTIGKSHFPIPCLNGNMIYLLRYFKFDAEDKIRRVVEFFSKYHRFDDGDFKTPKDFPYFNNKSCYSKHTCYWGGIKLLKGLSFIPKNNRSKMAQTLIQQCIDYVLIHEVCFSSHHPDQLLHSMIGRLTIPSMYKADFLEILWLLMREDVQSEKMKKAFDLLKSKMKPDGTWELEHQVKKLIVPITKRNLGNALITKRAKAIMEYYSF